ncbi:MAG: pantoate--beta-alanine ligase [Bacteroidales bacterium]|nr:pantoate--beta-alanine ligase [Bacteroidales bacterium]
MEELNTIIEVKKHLGAIRSEDKSIGFVPTMGALHEGHLSLIREAKKENDYVVCSIFVNPAQFNDKADLEKYPKEMESDIEKLKKEKCDFIFNPSVEEIYPEPDNTVFDFGDLDKVMEGKFRPGHFNGVAIVVKKLFEIIEPKRAYFGLKDYQQLVIIHQLTKDLNLPVEIVPCSTRREDNGLAMSSRNKLLSNPERNDASLIYQTLKSVKIQSGFTTISEIKEIVHLQFKKYGSMELEYFEIVDMYSLKPLRVWAESNNIIACIAVRVGKVRLIDNMILFS